MKGCIASIACLALLLAGATTAFPQNRSTTSNTSSAKPVKIKPGEKPYTGVTDVKTGQRTSPPHVLDANSGKVITPGKKK